MSKRVTAAHKLPRVFVACPYDERRFGYSRFKRELDLLPWTCVYANTTLHTRHLLERIKELINEADFSLFDLSTWNPNVALELGLADGLSRKPYYILTNSNLSRDVPSDIKGLQRIEYNHLSRGIGSLRQQLIEYFFKSQYHPTRILWNELKDNQEDPYQSYVFGLQVLAHLRDHAAASLDKCAGIAKALGLRKDTWTDTCEEMWDEALLVEMQHGGGYRLYNKNVYKRAK
jgi:hypothetical protein